MNDNLSEASTCCDGSCDCTGFPANHYCGTLCCGRCNHQHSKTIRVHAGGDIYILRLVGTGVYEIQADTLYGNAFRSQQTVWIENHPTIPSDLYNFD